MITMLDKDEIVKAFPASQFRKYQKETLLSMAEGFASGHKCILLEAPTGSGKSLLNTAFCKIWRSFYTTPQLALIDQIMRDKYLKQVFVDIKGRQNYDCYYDPIATCDIGLCRRVQSYSCERFEVCPYWIQKQKALSSDSVLMSFAYFMLEGMVDTEYSFGNRDLLVLDEAHSIDQHVISHIDLTISPYSMPFAVYEDIRGLLSRETRTYDEVKALVGTILDAVSFESEKLVQMTLDGRELSLDQAKSSNKLNDWKTNAERFVTTCDQTEWVWQAGWTSYRNSSYRTFTVQPLYARFFTKELIWSKANRYIVSSATILNPANYVQQVGLDRVLGADEILHLRVPSTFPVENRPVVDVTDGKLTREHKDENMEWAVKILQIVLDHEPDVNVAVHCVSYGNAAEIYNRVEDKYKMRMILQMPETRREDLEVWLKSKGKVFLSVAYTEGQDWAGELCEAQILFKVPYMQIGDRRVARRLEKKEWKWYRLEALKQVIQAYGRAVRSETDKAKFYVIDESFIDLLRYTRRDMPSWFKEALPDDWRRLVGG